MEKKIFRLMFVTIFIDYLSFGIIFPLLPYYIEKYGASPLLIGVIVGSFSLMQFIFSPFWGRLSDKVGRKKVIVLSLFGTAIAHLILAFSFSIWGVLLSRIIAGIFTSASLPTTYALIADITKEEERAEKFGILGAAWGLGFIFGPALGGFLSTINYALPFFVAAGIAFLNCIFVYLIVPIVHKKKDGNQVKKEGFYNLVLIFHKLKDSIGILFILFFIVSFTLSGLEIVFPLFGKLRFSFNESNIGFTFTFIGVIIALTQGLVVGKLVKKIGETKTIIVAHIAMILGYALLGISHQIVYMLLAVGILASGIALNEPSLASMISKKSSESYGTTLGFVWGIDALARVFGPVIAGYIYYAISPQSPFLINVIILSISIVLLVRFVTKKLPIIV